MSDSIHKPVLLKEVCDHLDIQPSDVLLDGTLGFGGHSSVLTKNIDNTGCFIGVDQDPDALKHCKSLFSDTHHNLIHHNFSEVDTYLPKLNISRITKCVIDLGVSSYQLDTPERGFSHRFDSPLDMRMNTTQPKTAQEILNTYSAKTLSDIFYYYGECRHNKKLVNAILDKRKEKPIKTTEELKTLIKKSYFFHNKRSLYLKQCAQIFQALRMEVNQELEHIKTFLNAIEPFCDPSIILCIITFHSIEDRLVKNMINNSKTLQLNPRSVIKPSKEEKETNPRSRSSKLRVITARKEKYPNKTKNPVNKTPE